MRFPSHSNNATIIAIILFIGFINSTVIADSVWAPIGGGRIDNNKINDDNDSELCWASAAANLLEWGNHRWSFCDESGNPLAGADAELVNAALNNNWFQYFKDHWSNGGFDCDLALRWIFEGIDTTPLWHHIPGVTGAVLEVDGGASYSEGSYGLTYIDNPGSNTVPELVALLNNYAVALSLSSDNGSHVVTCYGIDYQYNDSSGDYSGIIHFTDSDDINHEKGYCQTIPFFTDGGYLCFDYYTDYTVKGLITLCPAAVPSFAIVSTHGDHGVISPIGTIYVDFGEDVVFNATPDVGYVVDRWYVNGNDVGGGAASLLLENVTEDKTVNVTFKLSSQDGEIKTITATADSSVVSSNANSNFGNSITFWVQEGTDDYYGLVKFNIDDIPDGSVIDDVELKLYCSYAAGDLKQLYIVNVNSSWSESTVTWNTKPSFGNDCSFFNSVSGIGYQNIGHSELTDIVQAWVNGTINNYGF